MSENNPTKRLAELEAIWRERFIEQPKLPTSALLTGAIAMALGFGTVLFVIGAILTHYATTWITLVAVFGGLSLCCGIVNRVLARRWYKHKVVPWGDERKATKTRIDELRGDTVKPETLKP